MAAGRGRCGRAAVSLRPSPLPKPTLAPRAGHTWGTQLHRRDTWAGGTLLRGGDFSEAEGMQGLSLSMCVALCRRMWHLEGQGRGPRPGRVCPMHALT